MEQRYYLPINSTSLAHYFGCACIKPSKYFENKQEDLQDKFNDFLLVTTHFGTQQTDCCLELVFTKQETADLIDIKGGFYLYEKPLPITRVRKIFFTSEEQKKQTITNINMSTAFVPDELVEIAGNGFDNVQTDKLEKPPDIHIVEYHKQLKHFDRFLGGLALMRLAGEDYMNYSENYFATLSLFNSVIQSDLEHSKVRIDTRYHGAFTGGGGFQKIIPYLDKTIDETDINSIAQDEDQIVQKDKITRIIDLNRLNGWTYTVAVLNTYGVDNESKKKRIDELILSNFKSDIKSGKSEGIALCYGINRGYSTFSNKYSLGENKKIVKFQLNSQLDYYTIESLYQYAFNNNVKSGEFAYLKDWCPKQKWFNKIGKKTDYKILDVIVIGKKKAKVSSLEYLENLLLQFFQKDSISFFKGLFEKVRDIIYNDAKEEIEDDFEKQIAQKQEEIENLKADHKRLLEESQKTVPTKEYKQQERQPIATVTEPQTSNLSKHDARKIAEQVLKYKEKTKKMLEDEAKDRKIPLPRGSKIDDIILLLIAPPDTDSKLFE
ncbi:MAG: hypothetical protein LBG80_11955 [Bacteroidales bacterium]|jgi:hypothetical protein|nr:hypothetical protein [Bacteroidales bacterium]